MSNAELISLIESATGKPVTCTRFEFEGKWVVESGGYWSSLHATRRAALFELRRDILGGCAG